MFCKNCNKEIPNDSQFCEYCGAKISDKSFLINDDKDIEDNSKNEIKEKLKLKLGVEEQPNIYFGKNKHFVDLYAKGNGIFGSIIIFVFLVMFSFMLYCLIYEKLNFKKSIIAIVVLSISVVFLTLMLILSIKALLSTLKARKALLSDRTTSALITYTFSNATSTTSTPRRTTVKYSYFIVFKYDIDGESYQTSQRVKEETFNSLCKGMTIEIKISNKIGVYVEQSFN